MLVFGLLLIWMGVDAYFLVEPDENPSIASLLAAGGLGAIVLVALFLTFKMKTPRTGYIITIVVCLLVIGRFAGKTFEGQLYPAMTAFISAIVTAACLLGGHLTAMKAKKAESA